MTCSYTTVKISSRGSERFGLGNAGGLTTPVTVESCGRKTLVPLHRTWDMFIGCKQFLFRQRHVLERKKKLKKKARPKKLDCLDLLFPQQPNRNVQFGVRQPLKWQKKLQFLWYLHRAPYWSFIILKQHFGSFWHECLVISPSSLISDKLNFILGCIITGA